MRVFLSLLAAAALAAFSAQGASAQARYGERPPLVVSPDLSAPWVLQLQRTPQAQPRASRQPPRNGLPAGYSVRVAPPPAAPERQRKIVRERAQGQVQTAALPSAPRNVEPRIDPKFLPQVVDYDGPHKPGTVVIDTRANLLYLVEDG